MKIHHFIFPFIILISIGGCTYIHPDVAEHHMRMQEQEFIMVKAIFDRHNDFLTKKIVSLEQTVEKSSRMIDGMRSTIKSQDDKIQRLKLENANYKIQLMELKKHEVIIQAILKKRKVN